LDWYKTPVVDNIEILVKYDGINKPFVKPEHSVGFGKSVEGISSDQIVSDEDDECEDEYDPLERLIYAFCRGHNMKSI